MTGSGGTIRVWRQARSGPGGLKAHGARAWLDELGAGVPVLTAASSGSHHLSGLARLCAAEGRPLAALLVAQPDHEHARLNERISLAILARWWTLPGWSALAEARRSAQALWEAQLGRPVAWLPPGGGGDAWTRGLLPVARRVAEAVREANADRVVLAAGSGTTTAALWAVLGRAGLTTPLVAVSAVPPAALWQGELDRRCAAAHALVGGAARPLPVLDHSELGPGYGRETQRSRQARALAAAQGIELDPFYSARALAWCLQRRRAEGGAGLTLLVCGHEGHSPQD